MKFCNSSRRALLSKMPRACIAGSLVRSTLLSFLRSTGVAVQGHFERERDQLHVQHAVAHGRRGFQCREPRQAEGSLPALDSSRSSDQHTKPTGEDTPGTRIARQEGSDQEDILQEVVMQEIVHSRRFPPHARLIPRGSFVQELCISLPLSLSPVGCFPLSVSSTHSRKASMKL